MALSFGGGLICEDAAVGSGHLTISSFILSRALMTLEIEESAPAAFYINDSIFGTIAFPLTVLRFFRIIVGVILASVKLRSSILAISGLPIYVLPFHIQMYTAIWN